MEFKQQAIRPWRQNTLNNIISDPWPGNPQTTRLFQVWGPTHVFLGDHGPKTRSQPENFVPYYALLEVLTFKASLFFLMKESPPATPPPAILRHRPQRSVGNFRAACCCFHLKQIREEVGAGWIGCGRGKGGSTCPRKNSYIGPLHSCLVV